MTRDERLEELWHTAAMLDDEQLHEAIAFLEEFVIHGKAATRQAETGDAQAPKSYTEFITELRATLRTSEDVA